MGLHERLAAACVAERLSDEPIREESVGSEVSYEPVSFPSGALTLSGELVRTHGVARHAMIIHPATGVPQTHYRKFATWLAGRERAAVLIYDYSHFGRSSPVHPRRSDATMARWAIEDQSAALDYLCSRFPEPPVTVIGHSIGGCGLPWHTQADRVSRLITVAAGFAHWSRHPLKFWPAVAWFWFLGAPLATRLAGYMPARLSGLGIELPAGVYWQWRRWCLSPEFYRRDWGIIMPQPDLDRVRAEVTLIGIKDDLMVPPRAVKLLASLYPNGRTRYRELDPAMFRLDGIGHLRVFSERCRAVWPAIMAREEECR